MGWGIIETEALRDESILNEFEIARSYEEKHPESDTPVWTMNKVKFKDESAKTVADKLSKAMLEGWDSLLWTDDKIYVVFYDGVLQMKNQDPLDKEEHDAVLAHCSLENRPYLEDLRAWIVNW